MTTRREILRTGLLGGAGLWAATLPGMAAMAQGAGGYKALVCVMLAGGMDGHDFVIPSDEAGYAEFAKVRERLLELYAEEDDDSRRRERLLPLGQQGDGRAFGLPRSLQAFADRYADGRLAVAANVGPLEEPTTRAQARAKTVRLPARLMSHNDQQSMWESLGIEGSVTGWGGRMADIVGDAASPFTAMSVSGNPTFLAGDRVFPYQMGTGGVREVRGTSGWAYGSNDISAKLREHFRAAAPQMNSLLASDFQNAQRRAVDATNDLAAIMKDTAAGDEVAADGNGLSRQLAAVAKVISLRSQIGLGRQVFFVKAGGWDTHDQQAQKMPGLQRQLSEAMGRFYDWTAAQGIAADVTAFTVSDFGRTLTLNSSGTDHGWGGHHFVLGGAVHGGRIVGEVPPSVVDHDQDFGRGRMIPTIATEQYAGALGRWFGLSDGQLADVLPRWSRFDRNQVDLFA